MKGAYCWRMFLPHASGVVALVATLTIGACTIASDPPPASRGVATSPPTSTSGAGSATRAGAEPATSGSSTVVTVEQLATWVVTPGAWGPIKVGAMAKDLVAQGYAVKSVSENCDFKWAASSSLNERGAGLEFRFGNSPDDLDTIVIFEPGPRTAEGIQVDSSLEDLRKAYGARLRTKRVSVENYGGDVYVVFGDFGALVFFLSDHYAFTPKGRVARIELVSGSTLENVAVDGGGC